MRVEYINPFVESTFDMLSQCVGPEVKRGELSLKPSSKEISGVAVLVGLAGDVEGRVLLDMTKDTALYVVNAMTRTLIDPGFEGFASFDDEAKSTIQELANMVTAQAVTKLHDLGFKFDLTPPALFTGENMEIATGIEALVVPMTLGEGKKIAINVAIREKAKQG